VLSQDIIEITTGARFIGKFIDTTETRIIFLPEGHAVPMYIPKERVKRVILSDGTIVFEEGLTYLTDRPILSTEEYKKLLAESEVYSPPIGQFIGKEGAPLDLFKLGAALVATSGIIGIINTNRECEDCTLEELEDFGDSVKLTANIQYLSLTIGGIMMFLGSKDMKDTNKDYPTDE